MGKPPRVFKDHSPTLRANPGDTQPYVVHNSKGVLKESDVANCIDANYWKGMDNHAQRPMVVTKDTEQLDLANCEIRKLLPVETERLMSLTDDWTKFGITESGETKELSDTQRYKLCGNGVVVDVVSEIIKKIKELYNG